MAARKKPIRDCYRETFGMSRDELDGILDRLARGNTQASAALAELAREGHELLDGLGVKQGEA
jgi:hypothetical protein